MSIGEPKLIEEFNDINENQDIGLPQTIGYWDPPGKEDIFRWKAIFIIPQWTPYDWGLFISKILFEKDYPYSPPAYILKQKIFNCNISEYDGKVCISIINNWNITDKNNKDYIEPENKNMKEVLFAISTLFVYQNDESLMNSIAALLYKKEDKTEFNKKVKEYIDLYANEEKFKKKIKRIR